MYFIFIYQRANFFVFRWRIARNSFIMDKVSAIGAELNGVPVQKMLNDARFASYDI